MQRKDGQTFIDYAKRARRILEMQDPETNAVIKKHKQKIAEAIKKGENIALNPKNSSL
ncbi:MAG: hypothetical protein ACOX3W_03875 [Christensenellaceae bacterium]